jgi:hypothetical protein
VHSRDQNLGADRALCCRGLSGWALPSVAKEHFGNQRGARRQLGDGGNHPCGTWPLDWLDVSDPSGLPSSLPSFLRACARLAIEAASRGDIVRAGELMEEAERAAALRTTSQRSTRG